MGSDENTNLVQNNTEVLLRAFENTDISIFMYYPKEKKIKVPLKVCEKYHCKEEYTNMPKSLADEFVLPEDYPAFMESYARIEQGEKSATSQFHSKDLSLCWRVTLTVLNWKEGCRPNEVLGIIEDISRLDRDEKLIEQIQSKLFSENTDNDEILEARRLISNAIGGQYYAIYHIWIESRKYICYQEQLTGILSVIGEKGDYEPAWDKYINNYIEPEDRKAMVRFADINTLAKRLEDKNTITHIYKRKEIGWTRGQFIVAKRDENGRATNVIYTVVDINAEKNMEIAQNKALFEAHHDSLTGVLNRNCFDDSFSKDKLLNTPLCFAMVDIDNFKTINDQYGHENGDKILKAVAENLSKEFGDQDIVYRLGGDEFGLILKNSTSSYLSSFTKKQQKIHLSLHEEFPQIAATLSIGICFCASGYNEYIYQLADEALYETKRNGRAGCTWVNYSDRQWQNWHDDKISLQTQTVLALNDMGLYRAEIFFEDTNLTKLYCTEATKSIFGFKSDITPEECYKKWVDGVDISYLDTINQTYQLSLQGKMAECTYQWNHPKYGKIFVRTGGRGRKEGSMGVMYGYHHALKETAIVQNSDEKLMLDAMSGIYFCSYYIDLETDCFTILKAAAGEERVNMQFHKAQETLHHAVSVLTYPEDCERMMTFTDFSTLQERLLKENHVDCEYMSVTEKKWCRSSFFPVKRDAQGKISTVLYVVTSLDEQKAQEAKAGVLNKKSVESLYNHVPGGIVMYEWDGKQLKTLHISAFYEKEYGYTLNSVSGDNVGGPDYKRIHPDDLQGYQEAVLRALQKTHELHYEFRVWNNKANRYVWVCIDATSEPQTDGTSLVYALYTDITQQKDTQITLQRNQASLKAALSASNLLSYVYDSVLHTGTCFTDENYFGLPKEIENYPDSLKDIDLFHPDDADTFIKTAHAMDNEAKQNKCEVRIKKNGKYGWYSCTFDSFFDSEKKRNLALLTVEDISDRMRMMEEYTKRMQAFINANEDSVSIISANISSNTFKNVKTAEKMSSLLEEEKPLDLLLLEVGNHVVGDKSKEKFRNKFCIENFLLQAQNGVMHIEMEHLFRIPDGKIEWMLSVMDMALNPITGEITGICYSKNVQNARLAQMHLQKTIKQDYPMSAIWVADSEEYFVFDDKNGTYVNGPGTFFTIIQTALKPIIKDITDEEFDQLFSKDRILKELANHQEYSYAFDSDYDGYQRRLEMKFSFLDKNHSLILTSIRDMTDQTMIAKLRHDSEHDPLTDLYNRNTVLKKCRKLLDEHPDDPFVMAHIDMKHFRLYNTFFGDEAGDKLLCDVADMFRWMDNDYEYWVYGRIEADVFCAFFPYDEKKYQRHVNKVFEFLRNYRTDFLIEPVIGVYFVTDKNMSMESMFSRATLAAKSVKPQTRNATVIYDESLEKELNLSQQVLAEMQNALEQKQFKVYLQPKYSLRNNIPVGAEALVRWIHPTKGIISPGVFIPFFESNGFITSLDRYMWEQVCILLRKWLDEGKRIMPVSVNVSRLSMFSKSTVEYLKELVEKYDIDPKYLELELTESAYIDDPDEIKKQMNALRKAGFVILMDDFGSGYSSLNTLRELPVDILKLDMKFLPIDSKDQKGALVLSSIVRMSKLLNLAVIAEGVEQMQQADFLKEIGCEYVQGYLFAKPMPVADYEKIVFTCEETLESVNLPMTEHVGRIIAESASATYSLGTIIPVPLAMAEYNAGRFSFLRVNPEFLTEFGLEDELKPASEVFRTHLSKDSLAALYEGFETCIRTGEKKKIVLTWNENIDQIEKQKENESKKNLNNHTSNDRKSDIDAQRTKSYMCTMSYEGHVGTFMTFVMVLMKASD